MTAATLADLGIDQLSRGRYQPRNHFNEEALHELATSIKEQGIIEPIIVRPIKEGQYEIIAGERRWRAAQKAGLKNVPCIIRRYTDEEAAEVSLIENIQREDLNPIEEANAYQQLMDEFHYIHEEIAAAVGKSRAKITNSLRLLKLDKHVQGFLIDGTLSAGHGKILAGITNAQQLPLAEACVKHGWSVRKLEKAVKQTGPSSAIHSGKDPDIKRIERLVADKLSAKVAVENDVLSRSGWLRIKYHDYEILSGILKKIGVNTDIDKE